VTWHGHVPLERLDQAGKIYVAVAGPGRRLNTLQLSNLIGSLGGSTQTPDHDPDDEATCDAR
jgi:hypothetical protein